MFLNANVILHEILGLTPLEGGLRGFGGTELWNYVAILFITVHILEFYIICLSITSFCMKIHTELAHMTSRPDIEHFSKGRARFLSNYRELCSELKELSRAITPCLCTCWVWLFFAIWIFCRAVLECSLSDKHNDWWCAGSWLLCIVWVMWATLEIAMVAYPNHEMVECKLQLREYIRNVVPDITNLDEIRDIFLISSFLEQDNVGVTIGSATVTKRTVAVAFRGLYIFAIFILITNGISV